MKTCHLALLLSATMAGLTIVGASEINGKFPNPANAAVTHESGQVREFRVTLLDQHGKPLPGIPVDLYGMRRGGRWPSQDDANPRDAGPWWHFTTDDSGQILARFPLSEGRWEKPVPRAGRFHFVVDLPDGRRAVSPAVFHEVSRVDWRDEEAAEWEEDSNEGRIFTRDVGSITLRLAKGRVITGTVVDAEGKPLPGRHISAIHDLHIESRTGAGGEIFTESATSDAAGVFKLKNVHTAACKLSMEGEGYWSRTQVTQRTPDGTTTTRWVGGSIKLPQFSPETEVGLRIEVAPEAPKYRYHGRVTDPYDKPLAGLHVIAGVSHHATPQTWSDSHSFVSAVTDAAGRWEILVASPWVRFFDVRPTEFGNSLLKGEDYESDDLGLAAPGEYHLRVKSADTPAKVR
jgi:protocatechuate 3,4-dioxygenase beta subunit